MQGGTYLWLTKPLGLLSLKLHTPQETKVRLTLNRTVDRTEDLGSNLESPQEIITHSVLYFNQVGGGARKVEGGGGRVKCLYSRLAALALLLSPLLAPMGLGHVRASPSLKGGSHPPLETPSLLSEKNERVGLPPPLSFLSRKVSESPSAPAPLASLAIYLVRYAHQL